MRMLIEDKALCEKLVQAGYRRMEPYPKTWAEAAKRVREFLQTVVGYRTVEGAGMRILFQHFHGRSAVGLLTWRRS